MESDRAVADNPVTVSEIVRYLTHSRLIVIMTLSIKSGVPQHSVYCYYIIYEWYGSKQKY